MSDKPEAPAVEIVSAVTGTGADAVAPADTEEMPWDSDALPSAPSPELLPETVFPVIAEILGFLGDVAERSESAGDESN